MTILDPIRSWGYDAEGILVNSIALSGRSLVGIRSQGRLPLANIYHPFGVRRDRFSILYEQSSILSHRPQAIGGGEKWVIDPGLRQTVLNDYGIWKGCYVFLIEGYYFTGILSGRI